MRICVVQSTVPVGKILDLLADDEPESATLICVAPSGILGWIRAPALQRLDDVGAAIGAVDLAPVDVTFDPARSRSTIQAGEGVLHLDWDSIQGASAADPAARGVIDLFSAGRFGDAAEFTADPATAMALLAGLAVFPPGTTSPPTYRFCGLCGTKELPPPPPPADCRQRDNCSLLKGS